MDILVKSLCSENISTRQHNDVLKIYKYFTKPLDFYNMDFGQHIVSSKHDVFQNRVNDEKLNISINDLWDIIILHQTNDYGDICTHARTQNQ